MNKARVTVYVVVVSTAAYLLNILCNAVNQHQNILINLLFSIPFQIGVSVFFYHILKGIAQMEECDILYSILFLFLMYNFYEYLFYFLPFYPSNSFAVNLYFCFCSCLVIPFYLYFKKSSRRRARIIFVMVFSFLFVTVIVVNVQSVCDNAIGPVAEYNEFRKFFNIVLEEFVAEFAG